MKTIMLVCSAGMSTSLLVTKMQKVSSTEATNVLAEKNVDVLLLGPQVRFMQKQYEDKLADKGIPVAVINMADYGMMNGQKVLQEAKRLMNQ